MGKIIGLDIGITSVGYGVLDENGNYVESGVRLFDEGKTDNNVNRRGARQRRRLTRRQKYRIEKLDKMFRNITLDDDYTEENILDLRLKGLKSQLSADEIYVLLRYMLKHRGITYLDDDADGKNNTDYAKTLELNANELKEKIYPCLIQKDRLDRYGKYRGNITATHGDEEFILRNVFTKFSYEKEINDILENNREYHDFLDDDFVKDYMEIFNYKRKYYEGPGDKFNRSKYGKFTLDKDEKGNYITLNNIFDILIGKCTIYKDEFRASASSLTAEKYNCLNDLNNVSIKGEKLSVKYKQDLFHKILNGDKEYTYNGYVKKQLIKDFNIDEESIRGLRKDKKDKNEMHTMPVYAEFKKIKEEYGLENDIMTFYDEIMKILTINTEREIIEEELKELGITDDIVDFVIYYKQNCKKFKSRWHSFSVKLMEEIIPDLLNTQNEQQTILTEKGLLKTNIEIYKKYDKVPIELILEEIYNPVVRKSIRQALRIINALCKKYDDISNIVIEMPRDKNSVEEKNNIKKMNDNNLKEKETAQKEFEAELGRDLDVNDWHNHKNLGTKIRLWYRQKGICLYSGKKVDIFKLMENKGIYEIDHIIPISISFDDSLSNKVLVLGTENHQKSNKTPYSCLNNNGKQWDYIGYKSYVLKNIKGKRFINNLLFEEDITKQDVRKGFINRNINDTRYSCKVVLNSLQNYFKAHEKDIKVKVVNGSFTNQFRKRLNLDKDRGAGFVHHGIDALICCYSQLGLNKYTLARKGKIDFEGDTIGEIHGTFEFAEEKEIEDELFLAYFKKHAKEQLAKAEEHMKYSHTVNKKANRQLVDATIYSTRVLDGIEYTMASFPLYSTEDIDIKAFQKVYENNKDRILMAKHDPKTFCQIEQIIENYGFTYTDEKGKEKVHNPFVEYKKEFGLIKKYSKKGNGPEIKKIKYGKDKFRSGLDITHKYHNENRVFLTGKNPLRLDIYFNEEKGKYEQIRIDLIDLKFKKVSGKVSYIIDKDKYMEKYKENKLNESSEFQFHIYANDIVYIDDGKDMKGYHRVASIGETSNGSTLMFRPLDAFIFKAGTGVRNDGRKNKAIGKLDIIKKCNVDILGNMHVINKEKYKNEIDMY